VDMGLKECTALEAVPVPGLTVTVTVPGCILDLGSTQTDPFPTGGWRGGGVPDISPERLYNVGLRETLGKSGEM